MISEDAPTKADLHSPKRILWQARCIAYELLEQAASTEMLGPFRSKKYDKRFANMQEEVPVAVYFVVVGKSSVMFWPYSDFSFAANTPVLND